MYKQDKATTEKHTRILRELVKRPENKTCADCKRQDARWASWNIGVFICIRCSGIHRSMGTHISKVKSVDLDTWTPEQMENIQKWGNHRANLYWEAHLRPGHIPPEHKLESFIRSKYESGRWAREGPPPSDPSVLENAPDVTVESDPSTTTPTIKAAPAPISPPLVTSRQPQSHRLLSATLTGRGTTVQPVGDTTAEAVKAPSPPKPSPEPQNDLFTLDFHAPAPSSTPQKDAPKKDVKNDILSLFPSSTVTAPPVSASFGQWTSASTAPQAQPQSISMIGTTGTAMWGAQSGWTPSATPAQANAWGGFQSVAPPVAQQPSTQSLFETQNVWGSTGSANNSSTTAVTNDIFGTQLGNTANSVTATQKKDDVFGDLWGDFK